MRRLPIALAAALTLGLTFSLGGASPAEAAKKRYTSKGTRVVVVNGQRVRITVSPRRSFLDAGTEVAVGDRKFTDYVFGPTFSSTGIIDPLTGRGCCWPGPQPFEPGYNRF